MCVFLTGEKNGGIISSQHPRRRRGFYSFLGRELPLAKILKIAASLLASASFLTLVAPIIGETIASSPPPFGGSAVESIAALGLPYEDVAFQNADGLTLRGWFIPAAQPESTLEASNLSPISTGDAAGVDAPAMVYAPATAHDQRSGLSLVAPFHQAGYHVLLFSYRGQALSDGRKGAFTYGASESRDIDAAVRFLAETKGIRRIGVVGHSAGAVSAILSAARTPMIGAVVAVAPYNCVAEVWRTSRPAFVPSFILDWTLWVAERQRGFSREDVCSIDVVDQIAPRPFLLIHGTDDQRITEAQARRLFATAQAPKAYWSVPGATHSGIRTPVLDDLASDVVAFFDNAWNRQQVAQANSREIAL